MKKPNKSKESNPGPGVKSLNRIASQKVITHVGEGENARKHQRHNSMNANLLLSGKSSDKNQKLIKQYSTLNKKVIEKIQCKTQENSESLENNGKTQRTALLTSNMISKANLSKIKLKIPNKSKGSKPASTKNMLINSNENKEQNLVESLKKEVLRLNQDNKKLRDELEEAKNMNLKFKDFATDLMRFYEKPGKIETKKK